MTEAEIITHYNKIRAQTTILQHPQEVKDFMNVSIKHFSGQKQIVLIQIGLCCGGSFVCFGDILQSFSSVYAIGIDLPNQTKYKGKNVDPREEVDNLSPTFNYNVVVGNSQHAEIIEQTKQLLINHGHKHCDLLFIDGDHSYNGCMADFNNYSPMVRSGGIIAFHDIGETKFDVDSKVWPEMKAKYKTNWSFIAQPKHYGIGVMINETV